MNSQTPIGGQHASRHTGSCWQCGRPTRNYRHAILHLHYESVPVKPRLCDGECLGQYARYVAGLGVTVEFLP